MSKSSKIWSSDGTTGAIYIVLFLLCAVWLARDSFEALETAAYDRSLKMVNLTPSDRIAIIDIDDKSIVELGRWPWSRDLYQHMNDLLTAGGAKVITYSQLFAESQIDPGRDYLTELQSSIASLATEAASSGERELRDRAIALSAKVETGLQDLNYDERLADSFAAAGNIVLPMTFSIGNPAGRADRPLDSHLDKFTLPPPVAESSSGLPASDAVWPIKLLAQRADALGHLNMMIDPHDGTLRTEALAVNYYGSVFPALSLATAAATLNLTAEDITLTRDGLQLGPRHFVTNSWKQFRPIYYAATDDQPVFSVDSFTDVFAAKIPGDKYRNKTVLIGASAVGIGDRFATPIDADMSPVMVMAHTVSSLLQGHAIQRHTWAIWVERTIFIGLGLYILLLLPSLSSRLSMLISLSLAAALLLTQFGLFFANLTWFQLMTPLAFLLGGHLVMTVKRFGVAERLRANSDEASAESNRMLGLAFQGQGQLDIAFDKFRECPLDDSMMEPLYNLALDFERKRQFNKAGAIYSYMSQYRIDFRDVETRLKRSEALDETTILGQGSISGHTQFVLDDDDDGLQKPMLGRYVVEKELGRGAMGTVYLGRDPKINRVVAIKTIALGEEFDEEDLASARERFFREAETAGRLNHPDIVTVYDAGEEHDLAYIAMEFLRGEELSQHTNPANLLPVNDVLKLIARVSEALSYAHAQDVVHRDIKPANIMFDSESGDLKITDFGIARITNSSKTKTGIVLGTPSYMSPEQLAGQTVTGKSDLFSLAVTLFQLLTGQLPFRADSMATLMFKIANESHTPLHAVRPELPGQLAAVIDTALSKDPNDRYESGLQMAHDIRECLQHLAA